MKQPKAEVDKRYEDKHKEERKAAHAVWGTSMNREDFEELNKFLKVNHIKKSSSYMRAGRRLKNNIKNHNLFKQGGNAMEREHSIQSYKDAD